MNSKVTPLNYNSSISDQNGYFHVGAESSEVRIGEW
jgi:hypothetical protein